MNQLQGIHWGQRVGLTILLAMLMVMVSLMMLELTVLAGHRGKGPGCGGDLLDGTEQDGDIILVMVSGFWQSGGPVITKNLGIEGGWQVKAGGGGCSSSTVYTDTSNFEFIGPITRSTANEFEIPVVKIDPSVLTLTIKHLIFEQGADFDLIAISGGGGITGVISNGAYILLENVAFANDPLALVDDGGGLYLDVRGNSRVVISGSQFMTNTAQNTGGGFEIEVYDGSQVTINNAQVFDNSALNGNGGGGRILMSRGSVMIADSTFLNNQANQGCGGGLSVEGIGSGPNYLILQNTVISGNNATPCGDDNLHISGNITVLDKQIFLPIVFKN